MNAVEIYEKAVSDLEHNRITFGEFEERIEPLADVEAVVRCKDCKNASNVMEKPIHPMFGKRWCNGETKGWHSEDWYCADGERKDGDGDAG